MGMHSVVGGLWDMAELATHRQGEEAFDLWKERATRYRISEDGFMHTMCLGHGIDQEAACSFGLCGHLEQGKERREALVEVMALTALRFEEQRDVQRCQLGAQMSHGFAFVDQGSPDWSELWVWLPLVEGVSAVLGVEAEIKVELSGDLLWLEDRKG